jgi:hypothetical protein
MSILPGKAEAWPSAVLDPACDDDKGFITAWLRDVSDEPATQAMRDGAVRQLRDVLGDPTERDLRAFMSGIVTLAYWLQGDCLFTINSGARIVHTEAVLSQVEKRAIQLTSLTWTCIDEPEAPDMTPFEGAFDD